MGKHIKPLVQGRREGVKGVTVSRGPVLKRKNQKKNLIILKKSLICTVSRRMVINPESDSSKLCFLLFYLVVKTPTKKTPKY
jgi:hypothetical protein